eukprot:gene56216-38749_t
MKERWVQTFPDGFNRNAVLLVDVSSGRRVSIDGLQDDITKVMASVYDHVPELGGQDAERVALKHAKGLQKMLEQAAWKYRRTSTMLWTMVKILSFATTIFALTQSYLSLNGTGDPETISRLKYANIISPLCVGIMMSMVQLQRPLQKFAALFAASKRIEGEIWRYRGRVGQYRARRAQLLLWWDGLNLIQQRMPGNKDRLISTMEDAVLHEHESFVKGALSSVKSKDDKHEDDADDSASKQEHAKHAKAKKPSDAAQKA